MSDSATPPSDPYWPFPPWPNPLDGDDEDRRASARAAADEEDMEAELEAQTSRLWAKYLQLRARSKRT
ncbi:hypothetical protein QTH97_22000 [Variovorax sp. J22R24]|uniref:hypothetical protein n=1 Tax=Variovorax gracilis TaxID=3053502 RepID=UPI002576E156|nr:hypothetical protein [Variovorax sp. J22R24]MDM0107637.1 hypothetical protein [Variovorax sp. J22R24]